MSTLRISNIEAKADSSSPTVDEQLRFTNSDGDLMLYLDGRTAGITTVGINTTNQTIKFDANNNVMVTGIITATEFHGSLAVGTSVTYGDNEKAYFGTGLDLELFHNGTNSVINNTGGALLFQNNGSSSMYIASDGQVSLNNDITFVGASANALWDKSENYFSIPDKIVHSGDTNTAIRFPAADTFSVETGGSERLRILSNGNIGVGTDTAPHKLSVKGTISMISNASGVQIVNLSSSSNNGYVMVNDSTGTTRARLDSSGVSYVRGGNFGVGTNNPSRELHVSGTGEVARFQSTNSVSSIRLYSTASDHTELGHTGDFFIGVGGGEKLRIDSDGKVGIGTNNPAEEFHLYGNTAVVALVESIGANDSRVRIKAPSDRISYLEFADDDADAGEIRYDHTDNYMSFHVNNNQERLRITSDGNIGVAGATGTDYSLLDGMVINTANGSAGLIINSSSSSHNAYMSFGYGSGSGTSHADQYSAYIGRVGDNTLIFGTNNNIRAKIDSNGNFNLGLSSTPVNSSTEQGVYLAGADSTQSVISSNVTPFVVNRMGTGGNDRNCIEFRNNGSLKGTVGAVGVNNGIFFQSGTVEVMRITNDNKVLVGLTTTGTSTSNNNLELAGTKMLKVGNFYIGYVIGTGNNGSGTLVLHKMGQNVGLQFSGMVTCHSYTGSAYLSGCIVVRYNTDAVTRDVTLQKAQSGMNFQIVSGTISGESGTYFGIKKNAGGTGSFYINAFVGGNIESYGGIREVSSSDWTTTTVHGSGIT